MRKGLFLNNFTIWNFPLFPYLKKIPIPMIYQYKSNVYMVAELFWEMVPFSLHSPMRIGVSK